GFLRSEAVSLWTESSTFWTNSPSKADRSAPSASDSPDGAEVERGGVAQRLRSAFASNQSGRKVLTCVGCASGTVLGSSGATLFNDSNASITQAALGVSSASARTDLINWARGTDNVPSADSGAEVAGPGAPTTVRASIHGDVLHSRPVVINFAEPIGNVVFYGGNDGLLHAVYGRTDGNGGQELWSFLPQEHFGKLSRLRSNSPEVLMTGTPPETGAQPRDYLMDGPIGYYRNPSINKVWLFIGVRRGGRFVYALDVSDPLSPAMMWRVDASTPGFERLGQTWSMPKVALVKSLGKEKPVLIMGGGYDTAEDSLSPGATTMGDRIYVLDAETGALLRAFETERSVPADIALMDSDGDGLADRGYVADIGATLYRIDFESSAGPLAPASWQMTKLAALADGLNTRKVFFAPDLVATRDFTAVMFGTGDREKPLLMSSDDGFFMIKDRKVSKGAPESVAVIEQSDLTEQAVCAESDEATCTAQYEAQAKLDPEGCFVSFTGGERVVNGAVSIAGFTYFATNQPTPPASDSCAGSLGEARTYAFPLFCEPAKYTVVTGGGLPPTPVTGYVNVGSLRVPFVLGVGNNRLDPEPPKLTVPQVKSRTYWFIDNDGR
ncbi:MAG TPA: PilC/PilY family type IV pilus protein, partial [Burkholderiaceae bacterium]|nr:PilC/PilY family type IV pilus protein [Burkholderiaceae bacterium]